VTVPSACLIILDGWGLAPDGPGNAVSLADTPVFDALWERYPTTTLTACGTAVGHEGAHEGDRLLGLLGRGHEPGADGPDRFVGDDHVTQARAVELLEPLLDLVAQLALGVAGLTLVLGLADAEDRLQARVERGGDLL